VLFCVGVGLLVSGAKKSLDADDARLHPPTNQNHALRLRTYEPHIYHEPSRDQEAIATSLITSIRQ